MVALVLERAGGQAPLDLVVGAAVAVEPPHADVHVAHDVAAEVGHRQATLVDLDQLVVERLDHRVDDDGQRDRRLVRVARVVVDLDHGDAHRLVDLVGGEAGAVGVTHRVDQVVDQASALGATPSSSAVTSARSLAQHGVADGGDLADRHAVRLPRVIGMRTPRSAATSAARS